MTEEEKKVDGQTAEPAAQKKKKKWPIVVGVVVAVLVVAGAGFWVWHEQPSFCNAICHTPMDAYLPTYEAEPGQAATDVWGNEVANASGMMAAVHRAQNGTTCLGCHVPTLSEQIGEGMSWITGSYEVLNTQTDQQVVPEKSLEDLVAARGIEPDQFCLNESCHNMTRDDLIQATADLERNPHVAQHGENQCSDCHKAHRASVNMCSQCHNDAPIPEGWISAADNTALEKELDSLNKAIQAKETELNAQGITAHLRHEVRGIDAAARKVTVCDFATGRVFEDHYDKLVLATGSSNRVPQVPGSDRVGVQTLKTVEDLIFLKEFVRTPYVRDIVILGGSWAGLEIAKSFLKLGRNVRIIEKEQQLLPQFDPEVSKLIQKELEAQGVQFNLGEQVRSFPGRTFVEQVQTNRGTYPCDLCVVAIGVTPNTGLLAGTGAQLAPNGAVLIGADLATSVPNIYAVGDCAACRDGSLRTSSLKVADLEIARTGLTETEARKAGLRVKSAMATGTDRPGICPNPHRITIKLVYEANTRQVLGAQAWGEKNVSARINAIAVAIRAGMTVEALGQVDFVYSSSSCSIWDPVQIVCGQAQ